MNRKVQEKKRKSDEEISELEAEAIIVEDIKFNRTANKLRRVTDKQSDLLDKGEVVLRVLEDGTMVTGRPSNTPYQLMNIGKALESAQKVSKIAAGEPSEISQVEEKNISNNELLDENGNEQEHIGVDFCRNLFGNTTIWVQTSYNRRFRKNYACMDGFYDEKRDAFISKKYMNPGY